jgi:hypothetical protein
MRAAPARGLEAGRRCRPYAQAVAEPGAEAAVRLLLPTKRRRLIGAQIARDEAQVVGGDARAPVPGRFALTPAEFSAAVELACAVHARAVALHVR